MFLHNIQLVWFTPIGMMSLVCHKLATTDDLDNTMKALGMYVLTGLSFTSFLNAARMVTDINCFIAT